MLNDEIVGENNREKEKKGKKKETDWPFPQKLKKHVSICIKEDRFRTPCDK